MIDTQNVALVDEVVRFLESGRLLQGSPSDLDASCKIIRNAGEIANYWDVPNDAPEDGWCWSDIIKTGGTCDRHFRLEYNRLRSGEIDVLLHYAWRRACTIINRLLDEKLDSDMVSVIVGNFEHIIGYRAVFGGNVGVTENIFKAYVRGGFPCGWAGVYPRGEMVVFYF